MKYLIGLISITVILLLAFLVSNDKKSIRIRPILTMIILQFILAIILMNTSIGNFLIGGFAGAFEKLLTYAADGINFVFGGFLLEGQFSFFLMVLMPIVFISALIGILQHFNILGFIIKYIGLGLSKINGMGRLESYNAVASAILGQSEVFISLKNQLGMLNEKRLYTLCTSAMSTISMSIVGAYMNLLEPRYVVIAIVLNLFGGFIIASIINPYEISKQEDVLTVVKQKQGFFEMLGEYILDGFKVAIIVGAMLVGFIALMSMFDAIFETIFNIGFSKFLGYLFSPLAYLVGIPVNESIDAGSIMATKLITNEFVAMEMLRSSTTEYSPRTLAIISVFLVSFANFSSIGIISGAVKALNEEKGNIVSRFGLKLLYGASLVSFLSATIVGLVFVS
ncbi:NupC/NupG family nucleoside CNT transporter [Thorsellia anophelis]|uniref:Nucleoside transport protein n=1 Tax=Thorsellia anophelis DSM 18579 TaxID=1123402 RepID=A0A1I0BIR1_9GAMM|nr:nucleoside transporter C-terminal domain-containing protein [Thorsellia anophelis]SET06454.1 nucleoside transport protein [Thorsellia anophelis DSM 18579]